MVRPPMTNTTQVGIWAGRRRCGRYSGELGIGEERFKIVRGWFDDTLPRSGVGDICLLHLDADWYESIKTALCAFSGRIVRGGFIVVDDYYHWEGCAKALDEFFSRHEQEFARIPLPGRNAIGFQAI